MVRQNYENYENSRNYENYEKIFRVSYSNMDPSCFLYICIFGQLTLQVVRLFCMTSIEKNISALYLLLLFFCDKMDFLSSAHDFSRQVYI